MVSTPRRAFEAAAAWLLASACAAAGDAAPAPHVWQRWEAALESRREHADPYAGVTLSATYDGPNGERIVGRGFWDGGRTFRIRAAFPRAGLWRWRTTCSDPRDRGLHARRGTVDVRAFAGDHPLYAHGFLEVARGGRHLAHRDGTPFLWMGDTAWDAPVSATAGDWEEYLRDRVAKGFTLVQIATPSRRSPHSDRAGEPAFLGEGLGRWNPAFWRGFEEKVDAANRAGLVVMVVGLMEPLRRYPGVREAAAFARNLAARLHGSFVILSPSFDSEYLPLGDEVGRAVRDATSVHLITQHPGTPSGEPINRIAERYREQPYLDFVANQTGHNNGDRERCFDQAVRWNLGFYRAVPVKPVINTEAFYDAGSRHSDEPRYQGTAHDARALGYLGWLSGSLGYTYGAYGLWNWEPDPSRPYHWRAAIAYPSSGQMKHMRDLLSGLAWWSLVPAPEALLGEPDDPRRRAVAAATVAGDTLVAYLPAGGRVRLAPDREAAYVGRWLDPRDGKSVEARAANGPGLSYAAPEAGDFALVLERPH
jgi:hypothetical protein